MSVAAESVLAAGWQEVSDAQALPAQPLVSVLMPVFNHAAYLHEAVAGVLAQHTDFPVELLIGEDCSTDDSRALALRFQARYPALVRVLFPARNAGMHANHRQLVAAARGEFLAYCEGDDYWVAPDKLAAQVRTLRADPGCGAVHTDFAHLVYADGAWRALPHFQRHRSDPVPQGDVFVALLARNFVQTCTLTVRAELVRAYLQSPLPADSYRVVDWPLCLFVGATHRIAYLDRTTAVYRRTPGSATNRGAIADIERALDAMRMADDFARLRGMSPDVVQPAHRAAMRQVRRRALAAGCRDHLRRASAWLRQHPGDDYSAAHAWCDRFLVRVPWLSRLHAWRVAARARAYERALYVAKPPQVGAACD